MVAIERDRLMQALGIYYRKVDPRGGFVLLPRGMVDGIADAYDGLDSTPDPSWTEEDGYVVAPLVNRGTLDAAR